MCQHRILDMSKIWYLSYSLIYPFVSGPSRKQTKIYNILTLTMTVFVQHIILLIKTNAMYNLVYCFNSANGVNFKLVLVCMYATI